MFVLTERNKSKFLRVRIGIRFYSHNAVFYLNTPSEGTYKTGILVTWAGTRRIAHAPGDRRQGQRKLSSKLTLL